MTYFRKKATRLPRCARNDGAFCPISNQILKKKAVCILERLEADPFQNPPSFERLIGDVQGAISRRINIQHRMVYQVLENKKIVRILRMWTHYE